LKKGQSLKVELPKKVVDMLLNEYDAQGFIERLKYLGDIVEMEKTFTKKLSPKD